MWRLVFALFALSGLGIGCLSLPQSKMSVGVVAPPPMANSTTDNLQPTSSPDTTLEPQGPVAPVPVQESLVVGDYFFRPSIIRARPGQEVQITFLENIGEHTFLIDEIDLKQEVVQGETLVFTAPTTPGRYTFYCDVRSHQDLGMKGVLVVE